VRFEKLPEIIGLGDSLPFSDNLAGGIDHLVLFQIFLGIVIEIIDLFERAEMFFGGPVTVETPSHRVTLGVIDFFHLVDVTMTALAGNPAVEVGRVIEINVVRSLVHPHPFDGLAFHRLSVFVGNFRMKFIASRRFAKAGDPFLTCWWQFQQVLAVGTLACPECSTKLWQ
jgi:hypothetical protein